MRRSEINRILRESAAFLERMGCRLPPFSQWSPGDWRRKGPECREIVQQGLGWDVTDFGSGDFAKYGLVLFTLRNGTVDGASRGGKTYAEKIMAVREGQVTPTHFHFSKMEDIINRGGGKLAIQLWNSDEREGLMDTDVAVSVDGVRRTVSAGGMIVLERGESVCLTQRLYHKFWGKEGAGTVMVGEVSQVNDDRTDNRFLESLPRFSEIVEDEPPLRVLCNEYARYYTMP